LLGGGGALAALILTMLLNASRRFWKERNWETLMALTSVILLLLSGVINPYWDGWQPLMLLIMARPFVVKKEQPVTAENPAAIRGGRGRRTLKGFRL
jgi:hypothetical protein